MANNGTLQGSPSFGSVEFGTGLIATSDSNNILLPAGACSYGSSFTVEAWLVGEASTVPTVAVLSGLSSNTACDWFGATAVGTFAVSLNGTGGSFINNAVLDSNVSIHDGVVHHCALVMDSGQTVRLYVDGLLSAVFSGTYAPSAKNGGAIGAFGITGYAWPGKISEVAIFNNARYTYDFIPPTSAYTGNEVGLIALYHLKSDGTDSNTGSGSNTTAPPVSPGVTFAPNNAAIVYSPGNWAVSQTQALSINGGSYFSTMFSGLSVTPTFNITNMAAAASEIYYRIDGYEAGSPWTRAYLTSGSVRMAVPGDTSSFPLHLLEVVVKSTSQFVNRWNAPSNTAVILTGLTLQRTRGLTQPYASSWGNILFFGDSITEGVRTVNSTASADPDQHDAMMGWAYAQRRLLGCEVGVIGFGGSGLIVTGAGNVPPLSTSCLSIMAGVTRPTVSNLKLIVLNEGTNDQGNASAAQITAAESALNVLLLNYPGVPIAVLRPFGGFMAGEWQAAIAGCNAPAMVTYIDTTGFFNQAYGDDPTGLHPSGPNNLGFIAPQVAMALRQVLNKSAVTGSGNSYTAVSGYIKQANGSPIANATAYFTPMYSGAAVSFKFGGAQPSVASSAAVSVPVVDGYFHVVLADTANTTPSITYSIAVVDDLTGECVANFFGFTPSGSIYDFASFALSSASAIITTPTPSTGVSVGTDANGNTVSYTLQLINGDLKAVIQ